MLIIGILTSARSNNAQALIEASQTVGFPAKVACVISEQDSENLDSARKNNVPIFTVSLNDFETSKKFEEKIDRLLEENDVQLICIDGFTRPLTSWFVEKWLDRLVEITPSLKKGLLENSLKSGARSIICAVHFSRVPKTSPVITQIAVPISENDDEKEVIERIIAAEQELYPQVVRMIAEGRVNVHEEHVFIAGN